MGSRRRKDDTGCEHVPRLMAMPGHPDFVAVECERCHATTGYGLKPSEAWERWHAGDVVVVQDDVLEEA